MSEKGTPTQQTGMDRFFAALRGLGIRRRTDDKWIAGVCSGLAERIGVDPVIVRAGLVLLSLLGGAGITIYLVAWALLPDDWDEIVAQRALRDGNGGSVILVVIAAVALFSGSMFSGPWWGGHPSWGFPWGLALTGLLIWWLVKRSGNHSPDPSSPSRSHGMEADQRVRAQEPQHGTPPTPATQVFPQPQLSSPTQVLPQSQLAPPAQARPHGQLPPQTQPSPRPATLPKRPRRRSGGPLMALLAIGLAMTTYGSLIWAANAFSWTGDHGATAIAGSLAAIGLLSVGLGIAGWRAGFVGFLAVILAVTAWTSTVVPAGIQVGGPVGDATWSPTPVAAGAAYSTYQLGVGDAVLDLGGLGALPTAAAGSTTPTATPTIPANVGIGDLRVLVPSGLTVKVVGHVSLGEILLPTDTTGNHQGGSDVSRSTVVGDGPPDVVVNAAVGLGQLTVVKE